MSVESLALGLVIALGVSAIVARVGSLQRHAAALTATATLAVTLCATLLAPEALKPVSGQPPQRPRDEYVSSKACRSCHGEQHHSWQASYHSTMTQPASDEAILPPWHGQIDAGRFTATLLRKGEQFWVLTPDLETIFKTPFASAKQNSLPKMERRIVLVTGSHHKQMYWYATGDHHQLNCFPFLWLIKERRWVPRDAAFLRANFWPPRSEKGAWNEICVSCHTTGGRPLLKDEHGSQPETDVVDHGIACEACHGPGQQHRERHHMPWSRYAAHLGGGDSDDIVNPLDLDAERANEVCGQCHASWIFTEKDGWWQHNRKGPLFVPGDDLDDKIHAFNSREPRDTARMKRALKYNPNLLKEVFWADGMIKVGGREHNAILSSACFFHGDGDRKLRCTHCHQMHPPKDDPRPLKQWADDQLHEGMRGDKSCLGCHAAATFATEAHTHHDLQSDASRCMNCHMPHATYTLLKATRNHMVDIPSAATAAATGRPDACSLCHLDKPLQWTANHLGEWYGMAVPKLSSNHQQLPTGVVWGLSGDALQRAIIAWSMGWPPAQRAAGVDWLPMVLIQRLVDPYPAVRFIAARSLKTLPAYKALQYDYIGARKQLRRQALSLFQKWALSAEKAGKRDQKHVFKDKMAVTRSDFDRLLNDRDDTKISLPE